MITNNSKIVIVDDSFDDVSELIKLLNKKGCPYNYYKGYDGDELPEEPLTGVRLLFLDFILMPSAPGNGRNTISTLLGLIEKIISINNGPYIIVAWTDNLQHLDDLKKEIFSCDKVSKPMAIIDLEKTACKGSLEKISKMIETKINDEEIIEVLMDWENHAKEACNDVLLSLDQISRPDITATGSLDKYIKILNNSLKKHLCRIAESYVGQHIKKDRSILIAAQNSLTKFFRDHMEKRIKCEQGSFSKLINQIYSKKNNKYSTNEKALMNSKFLVNDNNKLIDHPDVGNVYEYNKVMKFYKCSSSCNKPFKFTKKELLREFFNVKDYNKYPHYSKISKEIKIVLIEISAGCDHANKNLKLGKLLLGVLWPDKLTDGTISGNKLKKSGDYLYKALPIIYNDRIYHLTFNSRYLISIKINQLEKIKPILKARRELISHIQHWLSTHIARPGKTEF